MDSQRKLSTFEYIKGEEFTQTLKESLGLSTFAELADVTSISRQTISTWNAHNRNSHELVVRIHLRTGIPIHELILPKGYPLADLHQSFWGSKKTADSAIRSSGAEPQNPQLDVVVIKSFCLTNGQLLETDEVPYAVRRINNFGLNPATTIEVETNEAIFLIEKGDTNAVSGKYLIDVDGHLSVNQIQRLPGKKLAIAFGGTTMEVSDGGIKVIGRVAVTLRKD